MERKIEIEFPDTKHKFHATLCDQEEPELCKMLWEQISQPLKTTCHNTLVTGDLLVAYPRPPKEPTVTGSQANPIGRKLVLFSDLEAGMLVYSGSKIYVAYGNHLTEPVSSSGSVVAKINPEYIQELYRMGRSVWKSHSIDHKFVTAIFKRKEC